MIIELKLPKVLYRENIKEFFYVYMEDIIIIFSMLLSLISAIYIAKLNLILQYGDAESHINISKRVISGLTPGFGQLGGVWLPLQHIIMIPFVWNDYMWRTGIGGSIVSMTCFIIASIFIYKIIFITTRNLFASFTGSFVFITNPNILYLQSTPLSETSLIVMMIISVYYIVKWTITENFADLILGGFFIFCGSLIRYDAWFFIFCSIVIIPVIGFVKKYKFANIESLVILYSSISILGMAFWIIWNFLIFKTPFYFLNSKYSAHTQQLGWLRQGQLPSYRNILSSLSFYTLTVMENVGIIFFIIAILSIIVFFIYASKNRSSFTKALGLLLILTPFFFYVITLYLGVSIILIPELIPASFLSRLFNVRYGIMMLPAISIFIGLISMKLKTFSRTLLWILIIFQLVFFAYDGYPIILKDGLMGLSGRKPSPANNYVANNYDYGFVMFDDFSRTANPVELNIKMDKIIYVGNHPYWDIALKNPTKIVRWMIIRKDENDVLWQNLHSNKEFTNNYHAVYHHEKTFVYKRN